MPFPFGASFSLRPAKLAVARAEGQPVLRAIELLSEALISSLEDVPSADDLARLLEILSPAAQSHLARLVDEIWRSPPASPRQGLLMRHGMQLSNLFRFRAEGLAHAHPADDAAFRDWLRWVELGMVFTRMVTGRHDPLPWGAVLGPLCVRDGATPDGIKPDYRRLDEPLQRQLGHLLLLNMVFPLSLDARQVMVMDALCRLVAERVLFSRRFRFDAPYLLTQEHVGIPERLEGWEKTECDDMAWFLGFESVLDELAVLKQQLNGGEIPERLQRACPDVVATELLVVIGLLIKSVECGGEPPKQRKEIRHVRQGGIWTCAGFLRVRAEVLHKRQPVKDPFVLEAEMLDASQRGVGLFFAGEVQHIRVGALLALYQAARQNWVMGLVRRVQHAEDGRFAGVELVAPQVISAQLFDTTGSREPALWLPGCALWAGGALILGAAKPNAAAMYRLALPDGDQQVKLVSLQVPGNDFAIYQVAFVSGAA